MVVAVIAAAVGGLLVGSFLNVVAYRLPRGESLVHPRSRCPGCGTPIEPYDNIPVLSWLLLRGRCRHCGDADLAALPARRGDDGACCTRSWSSPRTTRSGIALGLLLVTALVPIALIDLEHRLIPNRITLPAAVAAVVVGAASSTRASCPSS